MRRLLFILALLFCAHYAHATNCAIASGASQSTIQAAFTAAGSGSCTGTTNGNTVSLAAGTYSVTSQMSLPCNANVTGAAVTYSRTPNQTTKINAPTGGMSGWIVGGTAGCSSMQTVSYIEFNGNQTYNTGCGGGGLYLPPGTTNFTVTNNWFHGVQAPGADNGSQCENASLLFMDGSSSSSQAPTSNVIVEYNIFGSTSFNDCANAMNDGGSNENANGGYCNGIGIHTNVTNVTTNYNIFHWLEEGEKPYEGSFGGCGTANPLYVEFNDFNNISRIMYESQCNIGSASQPTLIYIDYNDWYGRYGGPSTGQQYFNISAANGCQSGYPGPTSTCVTHTDYNVYLSNQGSSQEADVGIEVWGNAGTTASYNLLEGNSRFVNGIVWSQAGNFTFNNNTFNMAAGGSSTNCQTGRGGFFNEETSNSPPFLPSCSGNTFSTAGTGTYTSVQPSISPASGSQTYPLRVTFSNGISTGVPSASSNNRDANTGIWYTTDGSSPVPGSGTAQYIQSGGTISLSGPATVNAVGMWGAVNQPPVSPISSMGYVPSAVVSAVYTSTCTNCAATPTLSPSSGATSSVTLSTTTPGAGIWYTTDGSTPTLPTGGVPAGTSSSYTPMCQAVAQPPIGNLKNITAYGAVSGGADCTTAIQNACAAAGTGAGTGIYIPAGTFYHSSGALNLNCNVYGQGPSSELYCPSPTVGGTNCQLTANAGSPVWSNFSHQMPFTTRDSSNFNVHLYGANEGGSVTNARMDTLMLVGGNAGGFFNDGTTGDILTNNGIFNTGADCNYETDGAQNTVVDHSYVYNCGDDGISNISYAGETNGPVAGGLVQWNAIWNEPTARGISITANNETIQDNFVENSTSASGLLASTQNSTGDVSPAISNILFAYNYVNNGTGSAYDGNIELLSLTQSITSVTVLGNIVTNSSYNGIRLNPSGGTISNVSLTNNTLNVTGTAINNLGATNTQCSGNTQNGSPVTCSGTNPSPATGTSVTYSQCVVGTAKQYTGAIAVSGTTTINAAAVIPGLTNSNIGSGTFNPGGEPALTQCYQANTGSINTLAVGGSVQQSVTCYYASLPAPGTTNCSTTDAYGNAVTAWGPPSSSIISVGQVGSAHPGLVTGLAAGTANSTATVTGGVSCSQWTWTVSGTPPPPPTLSGVTISLQNGGTSVNVGSTAQTCANMTYTNPTQNTQVCGAGTDAYGTSPSNYTSSTVNATMNAITGVLTGVSAGSTNIGVTAGSFTSAPLGVTVNSSTPPNVQIQGAQSLQGNVSVGP